nr:MAG: capsid protein [Skomarfal virus 36]
MALSFAQQLDILSKGVETIVFDCDETQIIHYHFVGAPFRGLVAHNIKKQRDDDKIAKSFTKRPKANKIPLKISYNEEEGWKAVYTLAELSIADTYLVEEVIRKQRKHLISRTIVVDPYDPHPFITRMKDEISFGEISCRESQELAKHRNKLMHALNGNIIQAGETRFEDGRIVTWTAESIEKLIKKQYMFCCGEVKEKINFVSLVNELDMFENRKITFNFEMTTPSTGLVSIMVRNAKIFSTGKGLCKSKIKLNACYNLLQKLLSSFYFDLNTGLKMKMSNIFPMVAQLQSAIKEDTKRNSKTIKHDNSHRSLILQNKGHVEFARQHAKFEQHNKLQKIYAMQRKQDAVKTEKLIAQLQTFYANRDIANLQWKVPVDVRFGDFQEFLDAVEGFFSEDVRKLIDWASVMNCLYLIYSNPDLMVKWNACDNLRRILGIKSMSLALFASMILHVCKQLGFISSEDHPKLQSFDTSSTLSILVTLVLSILYRSNPKASTVEVLVNSCKDLPLASRGVGLLEEVIKRICAYVKGVESLDDIIPNTLKKIEEQVMKLSTKDGISRLTTDEKAFVEICKLRLDVINLSSTIDSRSIYYQKFLVLKSHVNNMYTIAQRSPVAGCGRRKKPVVFHIWGDAGIGKSRIIKLVSADTISTILDLEGYTESDMNEALDSYDQFVYYRPVGVQYEQNFVSSRAKIYVCDDANQVDAKHLQHGTPFPQAIIHLNNEHDHMLPVAEIEMKSQALFKSALIIATDNKQTPDLSYLQCPEAYHRRIDFSFKMVLKEEYSKLSKGTRIIDVSKLDLTQPNEHIYEFHSGDRIYSYEEVVAILRNELRDVHKRFRDETVVFKRRAQITRERMQDVEEAPEYIADVVQNAERPKREQISKLFRNVKSVFDSTQPRASTSSDFSFGTVPRLESSFNLPTLSFLEAEKPPREGVIKKFFVLYIFAYLPIALSTRLNNFFFGRTKADKVKRKLVLATIAFLVTSFAAYKVYKRYFPTKSKEKKKSCNVTKVEALEKKKINIQEEIEKLKESDEEVDTQKYNDGQPKSVKQKEKVPSKAPVVVVPIYKAQGRFDTAVTKLFVKDYVNSSNTELSCPAAYRTEKIVLQNMYIMILEFKRQGQLQYGVLRGTFLNDRCLITNRHFFSVTEEEYKTANVSLFNPFREYMRIPTSQLDVMSFAHEDEPHSLYYDLIAIKFPSAVKQHIDLTQSHNMDCNFIKMENIDKILHQNATMVSLCEAVEFEKIKGIDTITANPSWILMAEKQRISIKSINREPLTATDPNGEFLYTWKTVSYDAQTLAGSCGSVLVSNSSNETGKVIGIHMAGYCLTDDAFGQIVTAEMIQALKPYCQMRYKPGKIVTILPNEFPIIATIPRPLYMPCETKLRKTICYGEVFETTKAPAKLKYGKGEEHGAVTAIKKYLNPSYFLSDDDRAFCRAYMHHLFKPTRPIMKMTREVAIRGIEGDKYIQAMNRKSSCGIPLAQETTKTGKHEYLGEGEEFIYDHPRLVQLIDEITTCIMNNERPDIYFAVTMKDELKKVEKLLARIFAAGPIQYSVLFREYYIDYFAATMERRIFNSSLIGINMLSSDVDVLVRYLLEVAHPSERAFLAGDFKNFDGTLMSCLLWEIYEVIEQFYGRESKITRALWLEITDSRQVFGNAVAHIASGQPSGNPATTFVNTMYNTSLLYLVISKILLKLKTSEALEVRANLTDHFRVVTYGDDNLMSFSQTLRHLIDPKEITLMMKTLGHTYTNDAKDGKELEYKLLSEVSILKRTFSFDSVHGWIAPLELVSILECLNWDKVDNRKREAKRAQTVVNMRVAIRELSLHTQTIFEKYRQLILTSADRHNLLLPPECRFSQSDLRNMTRNGDNLFYFSDDFSVIVDHKLRQSIYSEHDEKPLIFVQDVWPRLEMKQWSAEQRNENQSLETTSQQIITYDNETEIVKEHIPAQKSLSEEKFYQFEEIRDHTVRDIVSRVYTIANITVPTGGLPGDILYTFDPLAALLGQANVRAKLARFGAIRANIVIRTLITTARTCSGAIMPQYIPPLGTQRATTLLQQSQSIREVVPLSTGSQVDITAPWVDAFLARNLSTNTGSLGTFRISRVTPSQIDSVRIKIQIFCPLETLRVEYPTFIDQPVALANLLVEKEKIEQLIARMNEKPTIQVSKIYPQMQMNSLRNMMQKVMASKPQHNPSDAPITAIKYHPGTQFLNDQGTVPIHNLTISKQQEVEVADGQFGSGIDEMEVEKIMNSENIIGVFPLAVADAVHTVLYARPCTITDFIGSTAGTPAVTTMTVSHQMFAASMAQQWSAKLHFKICGTHNQLHSYQLRTIFVPEDVGKYTVGQVMTTDDVNAVKGQIHKFGADKMMGEHVVEPMTTTNMKNVPSPRNAAGVASLANLTANQFTHECSYGMFYVIVEVPLIASAQVAPTVFLYIDFHASDVILSEAETWLYLLPQTQMKGIEGESLAQNRDKTKSQIIESGEMATTIERCPHQISTIAQSLGERITNLRQLATAATVFSNSFTSATAQAFLIDPFIFRTTSAQLVADRGQYNDHIDYLSSAYGFFKGGMIISFSKRGSLDNAPFGEATLLNSRNNYSGVSLGNPNGIQTFAAANSASSGSRVVPIFTEECLAQICVPYIQPFNINRTSSIDGFNNGSNSKHLMLRPYGAQNIRFFRSVAKDFTFGFLTSLPQYTLNVATSLYA